MPSQSQKLSIKIANSWLMIIFMTSICASLTLLITIGEGRSNQDKTETHLKSCIIKMPILCENFRNLMWNHFDLRWNAIIRWLWFSWVQSLYDGLPSKYNKNITHVMYMHNFNKNNHFAHYFIPIFIGVQKIKSVQWTDNINECPSHSATIITRMAVSL